MKLPHVLSGALMVLSIVAWLLLRGSAPTPENGIAPAAAPPVAQAFAGLPVDRPLASQAEVRSAVFAARAATRTDAARLRETALRATDPTVAGLAIRALGRLGLCVDDGALFALFDDPRPRVRQELVHALAQSGDPRAELVLRKARESSDPTLRALAGEWRR